MAESSISYGAVTLAVVHTNWIQERQILSADNTTYVCTQWTFDLDCVYNRGDVGMAYTNPAGVPVVTVGTIPPDTHVAIEAYLNTNRRTLTFINEGVTVLQSPPDDFPCDANNGPMVEDVTVKEIAGGGKWAIHFRVTTWVNSCDDAVNPLKSHRWRIVCDTNREQMSTRTIIGEAIFDVGMLAFNGQFADQYRGSLSQPVPPRFYRDRIHVDASDDGTRVLYQVVDIERYRSYGTNWPATEIECVESSSGTSNGFLGGAVVMNLAATIGAGATAYATRSSRSYGQFGASLGQTISALVPVFTRSINVRAFAPTTAAKDKLVELCLGIAYGRLGSPSLWASISLLVAHDPLGKYTEVNYQVQKGTGDMIRGFFSSQSTVAALIAEAVLIPPIGGGISGDQIVLLNVLGGAIPLAHGLADRTTTTNPPMPNSNQMRGSWVGKLVTQILSTSNCETPPAPPPPTINVDLP